MEFYLSTWPAELATPQARSKLHARDPHALEHARIRLGPFTVPADQHEVALELRLPPLR
ncbi:MAG TPA: hypothetical protein VFD82_07165 [Planctomycetota bacterium]|nr:hypothetical protein [Planctomycetota bacterium]